MLDLFLKPYYVYFRSLGRFRRSRADEIDSESRKSAWRVEAGDVGGEVVYPSISTLLAFREEKSYQTQDDKLQFFQ
jgi:hypothetical protein